MSKPIYVLGTGLSHDGSSCLLKDGKIIVAIEKERLTRKKHDGGNDLLTVQYCLDYAGITVDDLSLVVQSANFEKESICKENHLGKRAFDTDTKVPIVSISHHLAHAYSAVGTSPFTQCNVMVIDGCGSFYNQCDDLDLHIPDDITRAPAGYAEKNSFYFFDGRKMIPLVKDFALFNHDRGKVHLPTIQHSIGGLYAMASEYCFGSFNHAGKLMGLAPYGNRSEYKEELFRLRDGRVWVNEEVMHAYFTKPASFFHSFEEHFQYYADIARWVQEETERAAAYLFRHGTGLHPHENICYAGGVALNAVANAEILKLSQIKNFYIEPAAGDNGLAPGCAFYGWIQVLQKEKTAHSGSAFFGRHYSEKEITEAIENYSSLHPAEKMNWKKDPDFINSTAVFLAKGKTVGWFQLGSEFGPRALGHRSILANPAVKNIQHHINNRIKFREDFRPFAPAVLWEDAALYFERATESPYMILTDQIKEEWKHKMPGIVHVDGSCRVQTVKDIADPFYQLLAAYKKITGNSVLLNTSFNRKEMPIVETPAEAIAFFYECALDILVMNDHIITKSV